VASPQETNWHICTEDSGNRCIGKPRPLISKSGSETDLIAASNGPRIEIGDKEHILAEFRILLTQ
jgi:hypothetical protein